MYTALIGSLFSTHVRKTYYVIRYTYNVKRPAPVNYLGELNPNNKRTEVKLYTSGVLLIPS
jgi:hypothetical protein